MLIVDLDLFKEINDTHGHPAGDEVPRAVAGLLRRTVPACATTVTITDRTASVGVAVHPGADPAETRLRDLLLDADLALRAAKREGRDRTRVIPAVTAGTGPCSPTEAPASPADPTPVPSDR